MALLPTPNLDFTDKDFDSLRLRIQNLVRSVFPDWTDFNVANFGNVLIESFSFVGDVLGFYQDAQAIESRIVTATQRKNMIALTKLLGFRPVSAGAAQVDELFTLVDVPAADVVIDQGTILKTEAVTEPISFQLLADVTIPGGSDPPQATGTIENSENQEELFTSTGLPNQEFVLPETPFLDNSAVTNAGNGTFNEVRNFLSSGPTDRDFTLVVDQNDRATIRFGNGINGLIPTGTITVTYKTGGGSSGNAEVGTINKIEGSFTDIIGNPVTITVTNPLKASGGTNRQTIEQIRTLAPESIRALNRTVAREDFEINARKVSGVARALMLTSDQDASINENSGILFIIPQGGGVPSQTLKDAVLNKVTIEFPSTLTFRVVVQDPVFVTVNVSSIVFLRQGSNAIDVKANIEKSLTDFFAEALADGTSNPNVDFGFNIRDVDDNPDPVITFSDIFNVVRDTSGVRKISDEDAGLLINGVRRDFDINLREFPILGTVTLTNGDTGTPL